MNAKTHYLRDIFYSTVACALTALLAMPLIGRMNLVNIVMLFLLVVVLLTVKMGRTAGVTAAFVSVALFDVLFVEPRFSFSVTDAQYILTFIVMLIVALVISYLTSHLREQMLEAELKAQQSQALYELAQALASSVTLTQATTAVSQIMHQSLKLEAILVLPDATENLHQHGEHRLTEVEMLMAHAAYDSGNIMQTGYQNDGEHSSTYLPLHGSTRKRGVLAARSNIESTGELLHDRAMLEAVASITAASIERLHFVEVAHDAEWRVASERLRSSILSALSHDIRTPLTAAYGMADSLHMIEPPLPQAAQDTATALCTQILQLNQMVSNLLDLAKLQAGGMTLRREWQPVEEVIGTSLQLLQSILSKHHVTIKLAPDLPLLNFDAVLIERVLCNLLENAIKYGNGNIEINANIKGDFAHLSIQNSGKPIPADKLEQIFTLFERGSESHTAHGTGIGLSICRSIINAHGGQIWAENLNDGVNIIFTLPLGTPPIVNL